VISASPAEYEDSLTKSTNGWGNPKILLTLTKPFLLFFDPLVYVFFGLVQALFKRITAPIIVTGWPQNIARKLDYPRDIPEIVWEDNAELALIYFAMRLLHKVFADERERPLPKAHESVDLI
jgi:hypothetical protein